MVDITNLWKLSLRYRENEKTLKKMYYTLVRTVRSLAVKP